MPVEIEQPIDIKKLFNKHRTYSLDDYFKVIYMKYGSLDSFDRVELPDYHVAKQLLMPQATVVSILQRFEARGKSIFAMKRSYTLGKFEFIPENVTDYISSQGTLEILAPYNLKERVNIIRRLFGFTMSTSTLSRFYK